MKAVSLDDFLKIRRWIERVKGATWVHLDELKNE